MNEVGPGLGWCSCVNESHQILPPAPAQLSGKGAEFLWCYFHCLYPPALIIGTKWNPVGWLEMRMDLKRKK